MAFSEGRRCGFLWVLGFLPPLLRRLIVSANENKAKINVVSTLSNLLAQLSFRTKWHTACFTKSTHVLQRAHHFYKGHTFFFLQRAHMFSNLEELMTSLFCALQYIIDLFPNTCEKFFT